MWQTFLIIIASILIVVGNLKKYLINIFVHWGIYFGLLRKLNYDIFRTRNAKFRAVCVVRGGARCSGELRGLKFFILGAVSSAVFLLGVAFVYGGSGEVLFSGGTTTSAF